ncbi:MAG TPA: hypothetical protein VHA77_12615 [Xanthobacteraceae bacterium]|nr:hypothetical protein [Xanthobacteraceae bacterium]
MSDLSAAYWPWLALVGLGLFHGANPAMGWLFAVALGLHRKSERAVFASLVPIAIGHAAAVALAMAAVIGLGTVVHTPFVIRLSGVILLGFAAFHAAYGRRHHIRVGMQTGLVGLLVWSFLMASAHGAGFMVIPALVPICSSSSAGLSVASGSVLAAAGALALHSAAMLAAIGTISITAYRWAGVGFLRHAWVNLDWLWTGLLSACGIALLLA